jgi:hypothetical protein
MSARRRSATVPKEFNSILCPVAEARGPRLRVAQIASARELRLTGALKSSPPPELILEENNSGACPDWLHHAGYIYR